MIVEPSGCSLLVPESLGLDEGTHSERRFDVDDVADVAGEVIASFIGSPDLGCDHLGPVVHL